MRASLLSAILAASLGAIAAPAADKTDAAANVEPNKIDILGGDFGLVNNAITIEVWNQLSTALTSFSGSGDPQAKLKGTIAGLSLLGKTFESVATSFGDELVRWLGEQAQMLMLGTDDSDPTEIICSLWQYPVLLSSLLSYPGPPARKGDKCAKTTDGGSGPYKANLTAVSNFRTVYHPVIRPNVSLPIVAWTGCVSSGNLFNNLLTEIASHGYIVVTTGPSDAIIGSTLVSDTTRNIDWATSAAAKKYGLIDTNSIVIAGHACGGLEAMSASYLDPRVKLTMLFDSGISDPAKRTKLGELKAPIAYFYGGTADRAYQDAQADFSQMPSNVPVLSASLSDAAGFGTLFVDHAGRMGKTAVDFLDWKVKGNKSKAALFCNEAPVSRGANVQSKAWVSPLQADGWTIRTKNRICA